MSDATSTLPGSDVMAEVIRLARPSGSPFTAALVWRPSGEVIATGINGHEENPILHAEIDAISNHAARVREVDWREIDLYSTAEPCPMCQGAIEFAGIQVVNYGVGIPWLIKQGWWQIDLRAEEVAGRAPDGGARIVGGVLELECQNLFVGALA